MEDEQKRSSFSELLLLRGQYETLGYVSPVSVMTKDEAAQLLLELIEWHALENINGALRFKPHLHLPCINRIVHHPAILDAVEGVLGTPNILLWSSDFNIKLTQSGGYFSPHQDATYTGLEPAVLCVTVWLALSHPVDEQHGCLRVWTGSHKLGQLHHFENEYENNMLSRGQHVMLDQLPALSEVALELSGGQASLHHFHTVHSSPPNRGTIHRVGLAMRYIAATVRQTGVTRESVTLVRGTPEHEGFDLEPVLPLCGPITDEERERGCLAHKEAMKREADNYFRTAPMELREYDATAAITLR
jgi:hypothetical protein